MKPASYWIKHLALLSHPEGGWFKETYRSTERIPAGALPTRFNGPRSFATSIYFLLEGEDFSALHRIHSDETWHYHCSSALTIHILDDAGYRTILVGPNPERGEHLQATVPAQSWFGATIHDPCSYALVGCTVAPGFDFDDFEMAKADDLLEQYPQHNEVIRKLTRR